MNQSRSMLKLNPIALDFGVYFNPENQEKITTFRESAERLGLQPVPDHRPCVMISADDCTKRFPRLIKLLQWKYILSKSEAAVTICDYLCRRQYSCEAISWSGRTTDQAIIDTVKSRSVRFRDTSIQLKGGSL